MILVNLNKSWPQVLAGSRTALDVALGAWARKHGRVKLSYPHRAATALAEGCGEGAAARARVQHRQHAVGPRTGAPSRMAERPGTTGTTRSVRSWDL